MLKLLDGIKVLDLTRLLPGPLCTMYLAELGAEVIKIDPEKDYAKNISRYAYLQLNHNKTSQPMSRFLELVKESHVVVESFRPGVAQNLGIDFESLKKINPSLVYCSITGYGQTGPYKDLPGHDINYLAYAGILDQMGTAEKPALSNFQIADLAGGSLSACVGILSAIISSQKNKSAHFIDISMLDCVMGLNQVALATYQAKNKDIPRNQDLLNGGFPFYSVYETSDHRFIALGALEEKFWKNFCEAVQRPEWISWHSGEKKNYATYREEIASLFKTKSMRDWEQLLQDKECCVSPVLNMSEAIQNPQVLSRGLVQKKLSEEDGEFLTFRFPVKFY